MDITIKIASSLANTLGIKEKLGWALDHGATVETLLGQVSKTYPGFSKEGLDRFPYVFEQVMIFINGNNIKHLDGSVTPLKEGDVIYMVPLIAGG